MLVQSSQTTSSFGVTGFVRVDTTCGSLQGREDLKGNIDLWCLANVDLRLRARDIGSRCYRPPVAKPSLGPEAFGKFSESPQPGSGHSYQPQPFNLMKGQGRTEGFARGLRKPEGYFPPYDEQYL